MIAVRAFTPSFATTSPLNVKSRILPSLLVIASLPASASSIVALLHAPTAVERRRSDAGSRRERAIGGTAVQAASHPPTTDYISRSPKSPQKTHLSRGTRAPTRAGRPQDG
jgi:hypothetical protein